MTNSTRTKNFQLINKSALLPTSKEIEDNVRARSAKMRIAIKL